MKYTIIILSIALLSVSYLITESDSAYAMKTITSNWNQPVFSFEGTPIYNEATQELRDSKAVSFVPTFRAYNSTDNHETHNRYTNHNRSHMVY